MDIQFPVTILLVNNNILLLLIASVSGCFISFLSSVSSGVFGYTFSWQVAGIVFYSFKEN